MFRNWRCPGLYKNQVSCRVSLGRTVSTSTLIPSHENQNTEKGFKFYCVTVLQSSKIKLFRITEKALTSII